MDADEESDFLRLVANFFGLHGLQQLEFTHSSALGRSRLDRIYWNNHVSHKLDKRISCVALEWVSH